jgi:hypothetical protein
VTLDELIATFRKHLWLPDPTPLFVVLATIVANHRPGDPVWVLLVGPPSSGKTELLNALGLLDDVHEVSTFTKAGLLSASISRNPNATGGLLAEIGEFGIVVCKDFTSLLSESAETRSAVFAALREIYDGKWSRRVGVDGGKTIAWVGKMGLLAAVTETIDRHIAAVGAMGERFVFCRMPRMNDEDRLQQARTALDATGSEMDARAELARSVATFLDPLIGSGCSTPRSGSVIDRHWLTQLADLATRCRSIVERDARDRQVELVPQPEATARLAKVLGQLTRGLRAIGVPDRDVYPILATVALDGLSMTRRAVITLMVTVRPGAELTGPDIADRIGLPNDTTSRALEDLAAHRIVTRHSAPNSQNRWGPTTWLRERWDALGLGTLNTADAAPFNENEPF